MNTPKSKQQKERFYQAAVELEAKMDAVLFAQYDDDDDSHLLRNTALVGGAAAVGAGGLAAYGRGAKVNPGAGFGATMRSGAADIGQELKDRLAMGRAGMASARAGMASSNGFANKASTAMVGAGNLGANVAGMGRSLGGDIGRGAQAAAGAVKSGAGGAVDALTALKQRLMKVMPKRA